MRCQNSLPHLSRCQNSIPQLSRCQNSPPHFSGCQKRLFEISNPVLSRYLSKLSRSGTPFEMSTSAETLFGIEISRFVEQLFETSNQLFRTSQKQSLPWKKKGVLTGKSLFDRVWGFAEPSSTSCKRSRKQIWVFNWYDGDLHKHVLQADHDGSLMD